MKLLYRGLEGFPTRKRCVQLAIGAFFADKAFDNDCLRGELNRRGGIAAIPPKADRKDLIGCDFEICGWRHSIETSSAGSTSSAACNALEKADASYDEPPRRSAIASDERPHAPSRFL